VPVADIVSALTFVDVGTDRYRFANVELGERGVVFGGELLAKMTMAAAATDRSGEKSVKSAHGLFARPVLVADDVEVTVDVLHAGRAFASVSTTLWQGDRPCARGLVLLHSPEPDLIRHALDAPAVDGPELSTPFGGPPMGREVRTVGGVDIDDADAAGPDDVFVWVRVPNAPDDQVMSQALLVHATAGFLIGTAMSPHAGVGQGIAHRDISTGIIGHTISFHQDFDAGDWLLMANSGPFAGRGRSFGRGDVFTQSGEMVASYSQEAMIRHFPEGQSSAGRESTVF
jgi:acyl-CoA thioesterase-2